MYYFIVKPPYVNVYSYGSIKYVFILLFYKFDTVTPCMHTILLLRMSPKSSPQAEKPEVLKRICITDD